VTLCKNCNAKSIDCIQCGPESPPEYCSVGCRTEWETNNFQPGIYRHYKGGVYTAVGLVTHHETRKPMVLYFSHDKGSYNARPLVGWEGDESGWTDEVLPLPPALPALMKPEHLRKVPRFKRERRQ
jgi:hypothetical protein